jgi:NADH-quinone oxidoreductase subunit K
MIPQEHIIGLSLALFTIGIMGAMIRRNLLVVLMCLELVRAASHLLLVAFDENLAVGLGGIATSSEGLLAHQGQVLSLLSLAVGAAELVVGLSIVVLMVRNRDSVDIDEASLLKW